MAKTVIARRVFFVLLGAAALVLKGHYSGPFMETVYNYGGNVSASFAVYFLVSIRTLGWRFGRVAAAGIALLIVELFEVTNGFGVMTNVYDRVDFVANGVGVGLGLSIDAVAARINAWRLNRRVRATPETGGHPGA